MLHLILLFIVQICIFFLGYYAGKKYVYESEQENLKERLRKQLDNELKLMEK